jgi:hypothetical protein
VPFGEEVFCVTFEVPKALLLVIMSSGTDAVSLDKHPIVARIIVAAFWGWHNARRRGCLTSDEGSSCHETVSHPRRFKFLGIVLLGFYLHSCGSFSPCIRMTYFAVGLAGSAKRSLSKKLAATK